MTRVKENNAELSLKSDGWGEDWESEWLSEEGPFEQRPES